MPDVILRAEKFEADIGGLRLILMGDVHEMPILDFNIEAFAVSAKDWSTDLDALATLEAYVNVFNYSRSSWEPLIEKTPISFHMAKGEHQDASFIFDVISRKMAEITLSSKSIAMLSQIPSSLATDISLKPRGSQKPYLLVNDTGLDFDVWIKTSNNEERESLTRLKTGETLPWEFEDWRLIRERLDTDSKRNVLS